MGIFLSNKGETFQHGLLGMLPLGNQTHPANHIYIYIYTIYTHRTIYAMNKQINVNHSRSSTTSLSRRKKNMVPLGWVVVAAPPQVERK